jgi:ABC-2 type transport system permease protein
MLWSSFLAVVKKEILHIWRDKATLRLVLMIPVMQMILFGFIDQTVHDLPTVVVDQDRSVESRLLMSKMNATGTFKIIEITSDPVRARERIRAGRARVAVVIPPKFRDRRARDEAAQILVLIDGSESAASAQALASINGLVAEDAAARLEDSGGPRGLQAQPIILFNPEGRTANFIIPGLVAIILQLVGIVLTAGAIVREREKGTYEQLLVTPISPLGLTLGKLFPYLLLSYVEMTVALLLMRWGFNVPIRGNVFLLYAVALVYLLALLSLGLLMSARAQTQMEAQQSAQLLFLPSIFLSGYIFPFEGLPWLLRGVGNLFPATHMVAIMRGVVLRNADVVDLLPRIGALILISAVLVTLAARNIHKVTE